jgi:hypothetical protein
VVLHRDHKDFSPAPIVSIVSIIPIVSRAAGMGGKAAPRQRSAERQRTGEQPMSHLQHGTTSDYLMSGVGAAPSK